MSDAPNSRRSGRNRSGGAPSQPSAVDALEGDRLSQLIAAVSNRRTLEDALALSVQTAAEAAARADRLEQEHQRTAERLEAEKQAHKIARNKAEELDGELQRTKRKYRGAQWDVERERRAHASTQAELAAAQATLARYSGSLPWRAYMALASTAGRVSPTKARGKRRNRNRQIQSITTSGLFDREWYLAAYPDVAAAGVDPLLHFFEKGWREGRDPGPRFTTSAYLKAHPDVARAGMNPLVHYIEFGQSEGREIRAHRASDEAPVFTLHEFPEPFPVFRGDIPADKPVRWRRSYRLDPNDPRIVTAGELLLGYAATSGERGAIECAFERLADLSGLAAPSPLAGSGQDNAPASLIDAWYSGKAELRSRWRDESFPFVIRAYQHDPSQGGRLSLIGEGLITSDLDVIDASLANRFYPLLFVFADADGGLRGNQVMAFPSLCRGGLHYPELVSGMEDGRDPLDLDAAQAVRLRSARDSSDRLVNSISVEAGDGNSPMFDPAFGQWLEHVARVQVEIVEHTARNLRSRPERSTLALASDMVPTIHILGERGMAGAPAGDAAVLSLIVAGREPSQPALVIDVPRDASAVLGMGAHNYPAPWPRFVPGQSSAPGPNPGPAAIRIANGRQLSDSERLVPASGPAAALRADRSANLSWLILVRDWNPAELHSAILALSMQHGADAHVLAIVGELDGLTKAVANELFGSRVRTFTDLKAAAKSINTELIGYIGPGVLLHDRRCVSMLAAMLSDASVASAACVLVSTEKRGKAWHVSIADGGTIAVDLSNGRTAAAIYKDQALPWRSSFAVSRPPRDLWIARASSVKSWIEDEAPEPLWKGLHVCTSLVTASYVSGRVEATRELPLPSASAGRSTKTRALVG